jgi:hypothetical protein
MCYLNENPVMPANGIIAETPDMGEIITMRNEKNSERREGRILLPAYGRRPESLLGEQFAERALNDARQMGRIFLGSDVRLDGLLEGGIKARIHHPRRGAAISPWLFGRLVFLLPRSFPALSHVKHCNVRYVHSN